MQFDLIDAATSDAWTTVRLGGDLDSAAAPELRVRLSDVLESGVLALTLDLEAVGFMDSLALGVLVSSQRQIRARGGQLRLVTGSPEVVRVLRTTGLDRVFRVLTALPNDELPGSQAPDLRPSPTRSQRLARRSAAVTTTSGQTA